MSVQELQQHLIQQISTVNDADILTMLEEELAYSLESRNNLDTLLGEEDYQELSQMAKEPAGSDTISWGEFNTLMERWRTK